MAEKGVDLIKNHPEDNNIISNLRCTVFIFSPALIDTNSYPLVEICIILKCLLS